MSAGRKQGAVLRLLRGEALELLSRELGVTAAELSAWRDAFLAAGEASLKTRPADGREVVIARLTAVLWGAGAPQPRTRSATSPWPTSSSTPRSSGWRAAALWHR
jgi:hypothetical protein